MIGQTLMRYETADAELLAPNRDRDEAATRVSAPTAPPRRRASSMSVVMPCLNEAASLRLLLPRLAAVLAGLVPRWEIVAVDDGSTDDTAAVLADWAARPGFRALRLSRNFGKEAALSAGFDAAEGAVVVSMDADGQHAPELIGELLRRWEDGADMVYAVRSDRGDESWPKRAGTRLFHRLLRTGQRFHVPRDAGDFRLLDRRAVEALRALPERTRYMKGLYAWVGFPSAAVPYIPALRRHGRSRFSFKGLFALSLVGLTAFSTWPLRAVSVIGVLLALAAFGYGAYLAVGYELAGHPVSGWTTIVVGMALLSGVQLMSLGVVGEYLSRVFDEVKGRPLYVVRERLGRGLQSEP
jgi:glycosyltransferase involved in cell wall biosynthesis